MSSAANDDGTQWTRPAVQPQNVAEMLAGPLFSARGSYAGVNTSASLHHHHHQQQQQLQEMAPPQARHKPTSKPPKSSKKGVPPYAHPNPLLTKRVWRLQEYITDFHTRPKGQKKYRPGEPPTPIPVPLRYGEKYHEYESKLVMWLAKKNITLSDLKDDPNHERSLRNNFANMRVAITTGHPLPGPPRLEVTLADNSYSSFEPQLSQSTKLRKRDRSQSPPASRKRSARVVLQEEDESYSNNTGRTNNASYNTEPSRKIHLQRERPSPSPARSTASSSSLASHFKHPGKDQSASAARRPTEVHTIAAAVPPFPTPSTVPARPADVAPPKAATLVKGEEKCVAKLPGARAPTAAFIAAYVSCNCRQCMQDWNLMLTDRLSALENEMRAMRELQQQAIASAGKQEYSQQQEQQPKAAKQEDLKTQTSSKLDTARQKAADDASQKPAPSTRTNKTGEAARTAGKRKTVEAEISSCHRVGRSEEEAGDATGKVEETSDTEDTCSSKSGDVEPSHMTHSTTPTATVNSAVPPAVSSISSSSAIGALAGDPIKARMVDEYNALNVQILLNEKVVADSLQRVQATMLTDMAGAMQEHQQIQQTQSVIQSDVASRNKALAILIAYCWAYKQVELFEQIDKLGTLNIAHVQGVSHAKCVSFASEIESKHEFLASLKEMLDQIILTGGSSSGGDESSTLSNCGIDELNGLGRQIVLEEQALAALEQERMDEFMRLFQFSHEIRTSCRAILDGGGEQ